MFSALEIVLTVEPSLNTMDELILEKFLRTSSVCSDKVTLPVSYTHLRAHET